MRWPLAKGALLLWLPAAAAAQTIRGAVVSRGDTVGVPGVVVQLVDDKGAIAARALTDDAGEYRITAPSAGIFRLRTLRIGFRPATSEPIDIGSGQELTQRLVLAGIPFLLDTVRVAERNVCRSTSDSTDATAAVWEQVRGALSAAQITARTRGITATIVTYERMLDRHSDRILRQSSALASGFTVRPWTTLSAEGLRRDGYVVTDRENFTTFYAPDLDVLLSPVWLVDHCFQVTKSKDQTRLGIAFEPTRDRSSIPEIRGVLWLDKKTSELRSMEYRYVNIPREQQDARAGGDMEFARMSNGGWAITRWHIRMPSLEQRVERGRAAETRVAEIRTVGGELAFAARGNDTLFSRPPLVLAGTILDSITGRPIEGAIAAVSGTQLAAMSDARGRFSIPGVLPGEYTLELRTPELDAMNAVVQWPLIFTDGKAPLVYRMPGAKEVARARSATFVGTVVADSTQAPLAGADVIIPAVSLATVTDAQGRFRLADVPAGTHDVIVRRIGYGPMNGSVAFAPKASVQRTIVLTKVTMLDTISVTEGAPASFWEHRRLGLGSFLTRTDLDKLSGRQLSSGLVQFRALGLVTGRADFAFIVSSRVPAAIRVQQGANAFKNAQHPVEEMRKSGFIPPNIYCPEGSEFEMQGIKCNCYARVYVDRQLMNPEMPAAHPFNVNTLSAERVEAVEYYASPAETPMEYAGRADAPCGVLVIHLRRRP